MFVTVCSKCEAIDLNGSFHGSPDRSGELFKVEPSKALRKLPHRLGRLCESVSKTLRRLHQRGRESLWQTESQQHFRLPRSRLVSHMDEGYV